MGAQDTLKNKNYPPKKAIHREKQLSTGKSYPPAKANHQQEAVSRLSCFELLAKAGCHARHSGRNKIKLNRPIENTMVMRPHIPEQTPRAPGPTTLKMSRCLQRTLEPTYVVSLLRIRTTRTSTHHHLHCLLPVPNITLLQKSL